MTACRSCIRRPWRAAKFREQSRPANRNWTPMKPLDRIKTYHSDLTARRRDFHSNPELGFEETRTSDIVARELEALGIEVHRGVGKTGVVGVLREGNGPATIGLRADMDALPILE